VSTGEFSFCIDNKPNIRSYFASELTSPDDSDTDILSMLRDEDFQNEMQEFDELAQYYYDYYQENIDASSDSISLYMSGSTAASMLSAAGFTITRANFAELAASLGELAGIGRPVAAAVVVAIILVLHMRHNQCCFEFRC